MLKRDTKKLHIAAVIVVIGGEEGIRTLDTLFTYTRFPGVRLQPLIHLSIKVFCEEVSIIGVRSNFDKSISLMKFTKITMIIIRLRLMVLLVHLCKKLPLK